VRYRATTVFATTWQERTTVGISAGIGATTRYWKLVVGSLANRMRLVLVDFLGFGRTPKNRGPRIRSIGMSPSCIACLRQWHCNSRSRWSGTHWARGSR